MCSLLTTHWGTDHNRDFDQKNLQPAPQGDPANSTIAYKKNFWADLLIPLANIYIHEYNYKILFQKPKKQSIFHADRDGMQVK